MSALNDHRPLSGGRRRVLLTGASGVVGSAIHERLEDICEVTALVHHTVPGRVARAVVGDLRAERLGLGEREYEELCASIDLVVHCAADLNLKSSAQDLLGLNVGGTARVVELARRAGAGLVHVSTAFCGTAEGVVTYADSGYFETKRRAEDLVRTSGLRYAVVRPSTIIDDTDDHDALRERTTPAVSLVGFEGMLEAPFVIAPEGALADYVPLGVVTEAIVSVLGSPLTGQEIWVTAGDCALSVTELRTVIDETLHEQGWDLPAPRLITPAFYHRFVEPEVAPDTDRRTRNRIALLSRSADLMLPAPLPTSLGTGQHVPSALTAPDVRRLVKSSLSRYLRLAPSPHGAHGGDTEFTFTHVVAVSERADSCFDRVQRVLRGLSRGALRTDGSEWELTVGRGILRWSWEVRIDRASRTATFFSPEGDFVRWDGSWSVSATASGTSEVTVSMTCDLGLIGLADVVNPLVVKAFTAALAGLFAMSPSPPHAG